MVRAIQKKGTTTSSSYVANCAVKQKDIVRTGRGMYKLKNLPAPTPDESIIETPSVKSLPKEALLVLIETQARQIQALQSAHITFVKDMTNNG